MARLLSGLSRRQEQAESERQFRAAARKAEKSLAREIARATTLAGVLYGKGDTMAADSVMWLHRETIGRILNELWTVAGTGAGNRIVDAIDRKKSFHERVPSAEFVNSVVAEWIRDHAGLKITQITQTTRNDIVALIARGQSEGLDVVDIARLIRAAAPMKSLSRARTIALTEAHAGAMAMGHEVAGVSGAQLKKVWLTSTDDRTRDHHADMDGVEVDIDQPFEVVNANGDVDLMMYPGDTNGSGSNTINCRCVVGYEPVD